MTASVGELHDAVVASLKESGKYGEMSAKIRAELYRMLSEETQNDNKPIIQENFIINELIREYLEFNGYTSSLSVFMRETGQPDERINRDFLAHCLNTVPHKQIPILYSLAKQNTAQRLEKKETEDDGFFEIRSC